MRAAELRRKTRVDALLDDLRLHTTFIAAHNMARDGWVVNSPHNSVQRYGRICGAAVEADRDYDGYDIAGECFSNALHVALANDDLAYVEGYALDGFMAVWHAWLVREDGTVLDPTWGYRPDAVYAGLPLDTGWVCGRVREQDCYGVLESFDPREGVPDEALAEVEWGEPVPGPEIDDTLFEGIRKETA